MRIYIIYYVRVYYILDMLLCGKLALPTITALVVV